MHLAIIDLIKEVNLHNDRSIALRVCRISGCLTTPYAGLEPYGVKMPSTVLKGKGGSDPAGLPGTRNRVLFQVSLSHGSIHNDGTARVI
jgi:hypothetical protein